MAQFDPKLLVPAAQIDGFAKGANARTTKQVVLDNITKMKEQHKAGDKAEGRLNFKQVGDRVAFTIRANNTPLVLETVEVNGTKVEVREMTAPAKDFPAALDYYAARVTKGEYDEALKALDGRREARTSKMRETRAAKKAQPVGVKAAG